MSKPIAVCISDIHFNINNLELSSQALQAAISVSNDLQIPLVIAGDLHDTKAIIRAEVANRLLSLFDSSQQSVMILVGNHDLVNEKYTEHGLNYLNRHPNVHVIDFTRSFNGINFVPYQQSAEFFRAQMDRHDGIVICHQGFQGAFMGDYIQDKSSIDPALFKDYTIISGHYHRHQTIGPVTYIGSPFTMSFGEANDGTKGFLILNEDGTYTREILNLRKHVIVERSLVDAYVPEPYLSTNDLLWLKITGPESELKKLNKDELGKAHIGHSNFKLDLIVSKNITNKPEKSPKEMTDGETLDNLIDQLDDKDTHKAYLKQLWRQLHET